MASSVARGFLKFLGNHKTIYFPKYIVIRHTSVLPKKKIVRGTVKHRNLIASACESLATKGFLRSTKPYTPEENVSAKVSAICQKILGPKYEPESPFSKEEKFALLNCCFEELNHSVPNSILHKIVNPKDVIDFYETPVSTTTPLDELKNQELPPNLHIQYDYVRFNPETDLLFNGISPFPDSSTIVTGIKYKKKYKGYKATSPYLETKVIFDKTS